MYNVQCTLYYYILNLYTCDVDVKTSAIDTYSVYMLTSLTDVWWNYIHFKI